MKVIKNPITDHLPPDALKIGTSTQASLCSPTKYFKNKISNGPVFFLFFINQDSLGSRSSFKGQSWYGSRIYR